MAPSPYLPEPGEDEKLLNTLNTLNILLISHPPL